MSDFLAQFKARFERKPAPTAAAKPVKPGDAEPSRPIFLMVGSLSGCTRKDAMQYLRGLAETNVVSPQLGRIHLFNDKAHDRWVYEIHEGGGSTSIVEKVIDTLDGGEPVQIALVNGAHVSIEQAHGELFSLIHPRPDDAAPVVNTVVNIDEAAQTAPAWAEVSAFAGSTQLTELFPENKVLSKIGAYSLGCSFACFILFGAAYTVLQAGLFDTDALLTLTKAGQVAELSDNPVWQLDKARSAAETAGSHIKALKKDPVKGWGWELSQ